MIARYLVLATANVVARSMAFVATVAVARAFGSAEFGAVNFATSIVAYAVALGTCGLDLYAVRAVAGTGTVSGRLTGSLIALRVALAAGTYLALIALALAIPSLRAVSGLLALFGLSLLTGALSLAWVAEGLQRVFVLALADLGTQGLYLLLLVVGLASGGGIWVVPAAFVLAEALTAVGLLVWVGRFVPRPWLAPSTWQWRSVLAQSVPMGAAKVLRAIAISSDLLLLGFVVGMGELGHYAGAYKLYLLGMSLVGLYFVILFPRLVHSAADSPDALWAEVRMSLRLVLGIGLPVAALVALAAPAVLRGLYGPAFAGATWAFRALVVALVVQALVGHYRNVLLAQRRQTRDLLCVAAGAAAHLAFKIVLIPTLGIDGAAVGTLLGEAVLLVLAWGSAHRFGGRADRTVIQPRPVPIEDLDAVPA